MPSEPPPPTAEPDWPRRYAGALAAAAGDGVELTDARTDTVLGLAREVAHGTERRFAPLAAFAAGNYVAARTRSGVPVDEALAEAIDIARSMLAERREMNDPPAMLFHHRVVVISQPYPWDDEHRVLWEKLVRRVLDATDGVAEWGYPAKPVGPQEIDESLQTRTAAWSYESEDFRGLDGSAEGSHVRLGTLFMTGERLLAMLPSDPGWVEALAEGFGVEQSRTPAAGTFISLELNLATIDGDQRRLIAQLRLSDHWPKNRQLAPEPLPELEPAPSQPSAALATTRVLEHALWRGAHDAVQALLEEAGCAEEKPKICGYEVRPPVFYFAQPVTSPASPEGYLEEPALSSLRLLCRGSLYCDDPLSQQLAGSFAEGNIVLLRREYVLPIESPRWERFPKERTENQYLCLGWQSADDPDDQRHIEWDLCFAAQRLSLLDIRTVIRLDVEATKTEWLASKVKDLEEKGDASRSSPDREYRLELIKALGGFAEIDRRVQHIVEDVASTTEKALTIRPLAGIEPLSGARLRSSPPVRVVCEQLEDLRRRTATLNDFSRQVAAELDKAEAEDRNRRADDEATRQRNLNYVLAGLAGVTALSLVVGQVSEADIEGAAKRWNWWILELLGNLAELLGTGDVRENVVVGGVLVAAGAILLLLGYLAVDIVRSRRKKRRRRALETPPPDAER